MGAILDVTFAWSNEIWRQFESISVWRGSQRGGIMISVQWKPSGGQEDERRFMRLKMCWCGQARKSPSCGCNQMLPMNGSQWKVSYRVDWNEPINFGFLKKKNKKKKFKFRATRRFNEILFFFFEIFRSRRRNKRKTVARHRRTFFFSGLWPCGQKRNVRDFSFWRDLRLFFFFYISTKPSAVQLLSDRTLFDALFIYFECRATWKVVRSCFIRPIKCRPWFKFWRPSIAVVTFSQRKNNWIKLKLNFLVLKIDQRIVGHFGSRTPYFFIGGMDCGHVLRTERCHDLAAMASKKKNPE